MNSSRTVSTRITTLSWIPSDAVTGPLAIAMNLGLSHHDQPPPASIGAPSDLTMLARKDAFRFAHELSLEATFDDGVLVGHEVGGGLVMGSSTVRVGPFALTLPAPALPELLSLESGRDPADGLAWVRVTRSAGGRTAFPLPRRVSHSARVRLTPPVVWTTLRITLFSDGRSEADLVGASPFPRHWIYDSVGELHGKAGVTDWATWLDQASLDTTPWGREDSPAIVTAAGSELERLLAALIMQERPRVQRLGRGEVLMREGTPATDLVLVLDGVADVLLAGESLAQLGPGAVIGERSFLEGGHRTASVVSLTPMRIVRFAPERMDVGHLHTLAGSHQREHERR